MGYYSSIGFTYRTLEMNDIKNYYPTITNFNKKQILNIFNSIREFFGATHFYSIGALFRYIDEKGQFKTRDNISYNKQIEAGIEKILLSEEDNKWNTYTASFATKQYSNIDLMLTDSGLVVYLDHNNKLLSTDIEELRKLATTYLPNTPIIKVVEQINISK